MEFKNLDMYSVVLLIINYLWLQIIMGHKFLQIIQQKNYSKQELILMLKKRPRKLIPNYLIVLAISLTLSYLLNESINQILNQHKINLLFLNFIFFLFNIAIGYLYIKLQAATTKKQLVITNRIKRLIVTFVIVMLLIIIMINKVISLFFIIPLTFFIWFLSLNLNEVLEKIIMARYKNEATNAILDMRETFDGKVIGITGSYGKTTTKNILNTLLKTKFLTYMTPESYNTPGGISLAVRRDLTKITEVFICEMGAKYYGDIKEITDFVLPEYGIVTSIGPQHLETFGNDIQKIIKTKMSLIENLTPNGVGIINIDNEYIASYKINRKDVKIITFGQSNKAMYQIINPRFNDLNRKFMFDLKHQNQIYTIQTNLLGEHNMYNITIGIIMYHLLTNTIDQKVIKTIAKLEQIKHRQELKEMGDFTIIDDAFNANPIGMKSALKTLSMMKGRKIIITPGMIELGVQAQLLHKQLGKQISEVCDLVILVGPKQTADIKAGLEETNYPIEKIKIVNSFEEGYNFFITQKQKGDTLLIANDLPDVAQQ